MMKPYFIENYQKSGEIVKEFEPQEISGAICSKNTAKLAQRALRSVVEKGTGRVYVNSKDFPISGKTGTSRIAFGGKEGYERNGYRRYQASFCGFYPSDNPKYSTIVVIYSGPTRGNFYGATQAGPIFKKIAEYIYTTSPDWRRTLDGKEKGKGVPAVSIGKTEMQQTIMAELDIKGNKQLEKFAPQGWMEIRRDSTAIYAQKYPVITDSLVSVVNMGLKDAVYLLENQGYRVEFKGRGRVVAQTPAAGSKIAPNTVINLQLSNNEAD
jgi:cell division protein FtsI (penicillin-binding protein 3)